MTTHDKNSLSDSKKYDRSMRRLVLGGIVAIVVIAGGLTAWASLSEIHGAVVTPGKLVVEGNLKQVQHREGGIVDKILVKNGDRVSKGQPLLNLDSLELTTELNLTNQQRLEWMAKLARLTAERDELPNINFPPELSKSDAAFEKKLVAIQTRQFNAQKAATKSRIGQLHERIDQLREEISGLEAQRTANKKQFEIASEEMEVSKDLLKRGLTQRQSVLSVQREVAKLEGTAGELISQLASSKGRISETRLQIIQINDDLRTKALEELREAESKFRELSDKYVALKEKLARTTIVSPWTGIIHELNVYNSGAVISPGQAIMAIVPDENELLVEAEVRPQDIDQVHEGQPVDLLFENANNRTTPRLHGQIKWVSAYLQTSTQQEKPPFYTIQIAANKDELKELVNLELRPGMPVTAFIKTTPRTPLSFLMRPLVEMWERMFREK